jgi:hypothetical protein
MIRETYAKLVREGYGDGAAQEEGLEGLVMAAIVIEHSSGEHVMTLDNGVECRRLQHLQEL